MLPTAEQYDILDAYADSSSNLMIRAYAGTGKSSTLELLINSIPNIPSLLVCFNKSIAEAANDKIKSGLLPSTTIAKTLNSIGHGIWARSIAHKLTLQPDKTYQLFKSHLDGMTYAESSEYWTVYPEISEAIGFAKALGYIPASHQFSSRSLISRTDFHASLDEPPSTFTASVIDALLLRSIKSSYLGAIDFNDQLYMPTLFSAAAFPTFPTVFVDEYQDLSPINSEMIRKLTKSSRLIGVGDEAQAIYAFRGADSGAMSSAIVRFGMETLPLSISFRCPSAIVQNVHWRVPDFKAHHVGGQVIYSNAGIINPAAVLCRNNAPLLAAAFKLLASGHSLSLAGSQVGPSLIKKMTKLGSEGMSQSQAGIAIEHWLRDHEDSKSALDVAACMQIFVSKTRTLGDAISKAKALFAQEGSLRLSTIHKAKGLEFERVYHLDSDLIGNVDQEPNVKYVADTRSSDTLAYISSEELT